MIVDGKKMAKDILARAKSRAAELGRPVSVEVLVANETPATRSYLSIKAKRAEEAGCALLVRRFPETVSTQELAEAITASNAQAILVQLPLPEGVDTRAVCDAIVSEKDADVLSTASRSGAGSVLPPVVGAIAEILDTHGILVKGKNAVVVGEGFLVGVPAAAWLIEQGAQVEVLSKKSLSMREVLLQADIIVSGAGSPHLIQPDMLKEGVVLVDAGTSESGGTIAGDADPSCARHCALFTPVPGGVGPVAVAKLFENAVALALAQK